MNYLSLLVLFSALALFSTSDAPQSNESDGFTPNDPEFVKQWGAFNATGYDIDAVAAWQIERGNRKVAIAILDTGIDLSHPDLVNNLWTNPREIVNGIDDDKNGYIDDIHGINAITATGNPQDDNGHGTHIAGIIGAEGNNGIGIAGVMHEVSLISCKFLDANGTGSVKNAVRCLDYIADLVEREDDITIVATNNAWGGGGFDGELYEAIQRHRDLGILFVVDAGNSGHDIDEEEAYPANYDLENVITVAKADQDGKLAHFTNYGANSVDIAAPGVTIVSTKLGGEYKPLSGSMATGFVSGLAGLLSAHDPSLGWAQIKYKILAGAEKFGSAEDRSKIISGGLLNARSSLSL